MMSLFWAIRFSRSDQPFEVPELIVGRLLLSNLPQITTNFSQLATVLRSPAIFYHPPARVILAHFTADLLAAA